MGLSLGLGGEIPSKREDQSKVTPQACRASQTPGWGPQSVRSTVKGFALEVLNLKDPGGGFSWPGTVAGWSLGKRPTSCGCTQSPLVQGE